VQARSCDDGVGDRTTTLGHGFRGGSWRWRHRIEDKQARRRRFQLRNCGGGVTGLTTTGGIYPLGRRSQATMLFSLQGWRRCTHGSTGADVKAESQSILLSGCCVVLVPAVVNVCVCVCVLFLMMCVGCHGCLRFFLCGLAPAVVGGAAAALVCCCRMWVLLLLLLHSCCCSCWYSCRNYMHAGGRPCRAYGTVHRTSSGHSSCASQALNTGARPRAANHRCCRLPALTIAISLSSLRPIHRRCRAARRATRPVCVISATAAYAKPHQP
jgi:hypothetical protein